MPSIRFRRKNWKKWTRPGQRVRSMSMTGLMKTPMMIPKTSHPPQRFRERIKFGAPPGGGLTTAQAHRTAAKHQTRRIALFGGSFDPIHSGHLAVARAADRRFNFDEMHFIPASCPPHKLK